jgi:hypothetical protein
MLDDRRVDRSDIPRGICLSHDAIGSPNTTVSTPAWRRCAAADSPYGPAPITATSCTINLLHVLSFVIAAMGGLP